MRRRKFALPSAGRVQSLGGNGYGTKISKKSTLSGGKSSATNSRAKKKKKTRKKKSAGGLHAWAKRKKKGLRTLFDEDEDRNGSAVI